VLRLPGPHEASWPGQTPSDICAHCGQPENPSSAGALVPFGSESVGHVWLHKRRWKALRMGPRMSEATPIDAKVSRQAWVRRFNGYPNIPWDLWDAAVKKARSS
jgi:hypothetical protein